MPRPLRLTMFFDDGISGWSETHYDVLASSLTVAVQNAVLKLLPARVNLLADGPWCKYLRASYDDTFRDSQVFFLPEPIRDTSLGTNPYLNNPAWKGLYSGEPWTVALCRGISGDLYRKQIYVSGTPYVDETDIGTPLGDAALLAAFQTYRGVLTAGYGFPIWRRDVTTYPLKPIQGISSVAPYNITVPNHGVPSPPPPGSRGFITQAHYFAPTKIKFNGPWGIVAVVDANTLTLANFPPTGTPFQWTSGFFQYQTKDVTPYSDVLLERFTHRKRGRPFDSPRGRSRRRSRSLAF